jgi:phosphatidylethanolamine-binding protein (PEBP) family uncharacterized protein
MAYSHNFHNYQSMSDSTDYESTPSTIVDKSPMEPTIMQKSIGFATLSAMLFFAGILIYLAATSKLSSTPLSLSRQQDQHTISTIISSPSPHQDFILSSPMFLDGDELPATHTCKSGIGKGIPPPLQWIGVPEGTVDLLLTMSDGTSGDSKWIVYNIPIGINQLNYENIPKEKTIDLKSISRDMDTTVTNLRGRQITEEEHTEETENKQETENRGNEKETEDKENTDKIRDTEEAEGSDSNALKLDLSADKTIGTVPHMIRTFLPYEEPCAEEKEHKEYSFHIYAFSKHITDADMTAATATIAAAAATATTAVNAIYISATTASAAVAATSDQSSVPQILPHAPQTTTILTTSTSTGTTSSTTFTTTSSLSESYQGRGVLGKILREGSSSDPRSTPPAIVKIMEDSLLGEASLKTVFNADVAGAENLMNRLGQGLGIEQGQKTRHT